MHFSHKILFSNITLLHIYSIKKVQKTLYLLHRLIKSQDQTRQNTKTSVWTFYRLFDHSIQSWAQKTTTAAGGNNNYNFDDDDDKEKKTCRSIWKIKIKTLLPWQQSQYRLLKGTEYKNSMNGIKYEQFAEFFYDLTYIFVKN